MAISLGSHTRHSLQPHLRRSGPVKTVGTMKPSKYSYTVTPRAVRIQGVVILAPLLFFFNDSGSNHKLKMLFRCRCYRFLSLLVYRLSLLDIKGEISIWCGKILGGHANRSIFGEGKHLTQNLFHLKTYTCTKKFRKPFFKVFMKTA